MSVESKPGGQNVQSKDVKGPRLPKPKPEPKEKPAT